MAQILKRNVQYTIELNQRELDLICMLLGNVQSNNCEYFTESMVYDLYSALVPMEDNDHIIRLGEMHMPGTKIILK